MFKRDYFVPLLSKFTIMNFKEYITHFEDILNASNPQAPYDDLEYLNYAKLNWSRMNRWLKNGSIKPEVAEKLKAISRTQKWVLITEPWCGDAAHSVPFIYLLSEVNPNIELEIQLRDSGSEIDNYLTNGGKSIPKLVIRDAEGKDITTWGPRPAKCQAYFLDMKAKGMDMADLKVELQNWYNQDKGSEIQNEILELL